ncbi:DEAD/DEAH box helicase [Citricoccus muralis]|uniref:DEAD/DEAH box helicase n=1 Tax=Citricoccus muralis TaxID=169134 RepID=A0ABY8H3E0_9MICC|nr:DEAD/DEAH box helicase [Citricoccus muralis]WFP15359.1 DEAD/DEAH box helicase [Citricoccus muralis]
MSTSSGIDDDQRSPAERYAQARQRAAQGRTDLGRFAATLDFELDDFQREACQHLEQGSAVLVAAPTGAGKTIVGEFAIHQALSQGSKAFYTTPIKALSNQKYSELVARYGTEHVGLLTGDTAVNPHAEVVVMTTEVLRNMIYADSSSLTNLAYVVMDEVHYLADRFRGAVWEEVIIHLPERVQLVALSATVSNAEEFGAWLDTVRGSTAVVVSEHRPVPLWQYVMAGSRLYDLFASEVSFDDAAALEDHDDANRLVLNPELAELAEQQQRSHQRSDWGHGNRSRPRGRRGARGRGGPARDGHRNSNREGNRGPDLRVSRPTMVRTLEREGLLPCIDFIFSRAGCDAAVEQCLASGLDLTSPADKRRIAEVVDRAGETLPPQDRDVLGFWGWRDGLLRGFASHHAGLLPPFKEVVEKLFAAGHLKVVFATETLALGINMPARTVVIEKLVKFNGESHQDITAGEYTQLTGRAGRRGIDVEGHAVVLWRPGLNPSAVAGLASRRTYPLNSSFRPTYNMSVNLLAQFGRQRARGILESSFAQFQADRSVVGLAQEVRTREKSLAGYEQSMRCHLGDFTEYARLRKELSDLEKRTSKSRHRARLSAVKDSLNELMVGDIVEIRGGRRLGEAVVVSAAGNPSHPRVGVITQKGQLRRLGIDDLDEPVEPFAGVSLPENLPLKSPTQRKDVAAKMRAAIHEHRPPAGGRRVGASFQYLDDDSDRIEEVRHQLQLHPCHGCSEREDHARWAERWWKLRRETDSLVSKISGRTNTIAKTFDRLIDLLTLYRYIDNGAVTERGHTLRRIYGERDLLASMAIEDGLTDGLGPDELAGLAAMLVYQAKTDNTGGIVRMPTDRLQHVADVVDELWFTLQQDEKAARLEVTPEPNTALVGPMVRWARGHDLTRTLRGAELAAGDFVRWARQVIDVLDQFARIPGHENLARRCEQAKQRVDRGIVAYSSVGTVDS